MLRKIPLIILSLAICIFACNGNERASNSTSNGNSVNVADNVLPEIYDSPCELVSEAEVRQMFAIPDDLSIKTEDRVLTYPTCSFEWEDGKVVSVMEVGSSKIEIKKPSEVMIVMVKDARPSMYETASKIYKDIETVEDIGEMASWGNQMSQLSFLAKNHLFHVHVKASNDDPENKSKAIEVAKLILTQL